MIPAAAPHISDSVQTMNDRLERDVEAAMSTLIAERDLPYYLNADELRDLVVDLMTELYALPRSHDKTCADHAQSTCVACRDLIENRAKRIAERMSQ